VQSDTKSLHLEVSTHVTINSAWYYLFAVVSILRQWMSAPALLFQPPRANKLLCPTIPHQSWILPILICTMRIYFGQFKICKIETEFFFAVIKFCRWIVVKNWGLKCSPWKCSTTKHVFVVLVARVGTVYCSSIEVRVV